MPPRATRVALYRRAGAAHLRLGAAGAAVSAAVPAELHAARRLLLRLLRPQLRAAGALPSRARRWHPCGALTGTARRAAVRLPAGEGHHPVHAPQAGACAFVLFAARASAATEPRSPAPQGAAPLPGLALSSALGKYSDEYTLTLQRSSGGGDGGSRGIMKPVRRRRLRARAHECALMAPAPRRHTCAGGAAQERHRVVLRGRRAGARRFQSGHLEAAHHF